MNRQFTIKIGVILLLALMLMIPLTMIEDVVVERSNYRDQVRNDIAQSWTGSQMFLGPLLVAPYQESVKARVWDENLKAYHETTVMENRKLYILPDELKISGDIVTEERKRGLYSIPVYATDLAVKGSFGNGKIRELQQTKKTKIIWQQAYLTMMVSDVRGVSTQPMLIWNNSPYDFRPGSNIPEFEAGIHAPLVKLAENKVEEYQFAFDINLKGMESIEFSPAGKNTEVNIKANWPHPSFTGRYLPSHREITAEGFSAQWKMSSFSSDMPRLIKSCQKNDCTGISGNTFGVALINTVDIYHKTERSVKYAILFISLTFITFFLFEIMKNLRLHPMQYLLVGLALTFFYLLLVSLSEHMAFAGAYLIASAASVGIIGFYISALLQSRLRAGIFSGLLALLYIMLYAILVSEDNALLMGSLLFFTILSLVMTVTRKLDWYQVTEKLIK